MAFSGIKNISEIFGKPFHSYPMPIARASSKQSYSIDNTYLTGKNEQNNASFFANSSIYLAFEKSIACCIAQATGHVI